MFKRTRKALSLLATGFCAVSFLSAVSSSALGADGVDASTLTTVHGKVEFQKRGTIVPMLQDAARAGTLPISKFCDANGCPQSSPYWALVVEDGDRLYEFHQPFAMGSTRAPETVELNGVSLHAGVEVSLEGSVDAISANYGIITDVQSVSVLSNRLSAMAAVNPSWNPTVLGWNCSNSQGNSLEGGYEVVATVWYGRRTIQEPEAYHLRVLTRKINDKQHLQGVTDIGNLEVQQRGQAILYRGAIDDTFAVLSIRHEATQLREFPSTLDISPFPVAGAIHLSCIPQNQSQL